MGQETNLSVTDLLSNTSEGVDDFSPYFPGSTTTTETPWPSIISRIIICVVGVIGNILVIIFILALKEYKRAASHWYVLQLAIADLIFLLTLPFKISEDINDGWVFTTGMCKAKETILFLNYYASIFFLTIMSIDRYVAVCRTYPNVMKQFKFTATVTIAIWVVSLLMCSPIMMFSDVTGLNPDHCSCGYVFPKPKQTAEEWCAKKFVSEVDILDCLTWAPVDEDKINACKANNGKDDEGNTAVSNLEEDLIYWEQFEDVSGEEEDYTSPSCLALEGIEWRAYVYFNFVVMFLVPFLIISLCYGLIGLRLKQSLMTTSSRSDRDRKKITAMCAVLVSIFVICWLPYHAVHLAKLQGINASEKSNLCDVLPLVASLLAYLNAAINPYLYNFIGSFKKRFRQLRGRVSATSYSKPKGDILSTRSSIV